MTKKIENHIHIVILRNSKDIYFCPIITVTLKTHMSLHYSSGQGLPIPCDAPILDGSWLG